MQQALGQVIPSGKNTSFASNGDGQRTNRLV